MCVLRELSTVSRRVREPTCVVIFVEVPRHTVPVRADTGEVRRPPEEMSPCPGGQGLTRTFGLGGAH